MKLPCAWLSVFLISGLGSVTVTAHESAPLDAPSDMKAIANKAFLERCVVCHGLIGGVERFKNLTPTEIYAVIRRGAMIEEASGLDDGTLHALADTLGDAEAEKRRGMNGGAVLCDSPDMFEGKAGNWPGWAADVENTHSTNVDFSTDRVKGIRLKWSFVFPDTAVWNGSGNPMAAAHGRIYVGSRNKSLYALDARTGCARWVFQASGPVRSGPTVSDGVVTFGDTFGNVYGVDERTGTLKWKEIADRLPSARITGSVAVDRGKVYVPVSSWQSNWGLPDGMSCCTFNGSVVSYDLQTGKRFWQTRMIDQPLHWLGKTSKGANRFGPSGVGVWSRPTIDSKRGVLYVGTANQMTEPVIKEADSIVALDLATGEKRWVDGFAPEQFGGKDVYNTGCEPRLVPDRQGCSPENPGPNGHGDRDFGAPVMIVKRADGKEVLIAGGKDGVLYSLDPDANGKVLWKLRVGQGGEFGGIEYGMATDGKLVYAPLADIDFDKDVTDGALVAVDLVTGKRVWRTPTPKSGCENKPSPCTNALLSPPLVVGEVVMVGGHDGILRVYDKRNGKILFSYDSVRSYAGVNHLTGSGGSFGMGGVVLLDDMLYVVSGAGQGNTGLAGNVLLAFEVPGHDKNILH